MKLSLKNFIVRSLLVHLIFVGLFVLVIPCSQERPKPSLNFLGAILSRNELLPNRAPSPTTGALKKQNFVYETPFLFNQWQVHRDVKKPGFVIETMGESKPLYKEVQNTPAQHAPRKHATLQEIGVSLEARPKLQLGITP